MDSWEAAPLVIAVATGLLGLAGGRLWARLRAGSARRSRAGRLTALRAELERQELRTRQLEADLHAQQARGFALERELEARESDWAQSSPVPFSFDAHTFHIDRSPHTVAPASRPQDTERIADLEQQVRDVQDLLAKVSARPRPSRARSLPPADAAGGKVEALSRRSESVQNGSPPGATDPPGNKPPPSRAISPSI